MALLSLDQTGISAQGALLLLELLVQSLYGYLENPSQDTICRLIPLVFPFTQSVGCVLLQGQQLAHSLPDIEKADQLLEKCVSVGKITILVQKVLQKPFEKAEIQDITNQVVLY